MLAVCLLFCFSSCQTIFRIYAGVRDPMKVRPRTELLAYMKKIKMRSDNVVIPKDSAAYVHTLLRLKEGLPTMEPFLPNGSRIVINDSTTCSNPRWEYSKVICAGIYQGIDTIRKLSDEAGEYIWYFNGKEGTPFSIDSTADYVVLLYWARFAGLSNKKYVREWEKNLLSHTRCKVQVVKVSLDRIREYPNYKGLH